MDFSQSQRNTMVMGTESGNSDGKSWGVSVHHPWQFKEKNRNNQSTMSDGMTNTGGNFS